MEETVNLERVLEIIKQNKVPIIISTLSVGLLAAVITFFIISPKYEAQTQVLVSQAEGSTVVNNENIETSLQLIHTYRDIILSPTVLMEVINNLELEQSMSDLSSQITVDNQDQSQVIAVRMVDGTPEEAERIANEVATVFQGQVMEIMNVDNVSILAPAGVGMDIEPVSPQPVINITIGLVIGLLAGQTWAFARAFLDKSIRNEADAQKFIGLSVVGSIAKFEE
jgi:capsular polysaccharide biosynthesis protein